MAENVITQNAQGDAVVHENVSGVELLTESGGTATFIHDAEIKQSDWNQTDIGQKDYIKNKPILKNVATTGSYNDLQDRPCGDAQDVVPETVAEFVGGEDDDGFVGWSSQTEVGLVVGESYIVTWGDKEFTCTAKHASDIVEGLGGVIFLGNAILFLNAGFGEDTGEPFIFTYNPDMLPGDNNCGFWTNETDATRTVRVRPVEGIIKLDAKYLPDGLATEDFVEQKIAEIEVSGGGSTETDIFPEQTPNDFVPDADVGGLYSDGVTGADGAQLLVVGEEYTVVWDGKEYTCTAQDMSAMMAGAIVVGDASGWGGNGNGEPFIAMSKTADNGSVHYGFFAVDGSTATSHTVRIFQKSSAPAQVQADWNETDETSPAFIKNKPDISGGSGGGSAEKEILPETTITLATEDNPVYEDSQFAYFAVDGDPICTAIKSLVAGETYQIVWNGTEYSCVATDMSDKVLENMPSGSVVNRYIIIGNMAFIGGEDNGAPFMINDMDSVIDGSATLVASIMTWPGITELSYDATIRIYQKTSSGGVSSWNDLTDKPFGETEAVLFDGVFQDSLTDTDGDGTNDAWANNMMVQDTSASALVIGQTYKVTWDGVEYECECVAAESIGGLPLVGSMIAITSVPDSIPFMLFRDATGSILGVAGWGASLVDSPTDLTASGTYTCKIECTAVKHLDNKYLDFMEHHEAEETDVLAEETVACAAKTVNSKEVMMGTLSSGFTLTTDAEYIVESDGVEYVCTATFASGDSAWYVGNLGLAGASDTGEPFLIVAGEDGASVIFSDTTATSHTIRIFQRIGEEGYTVKKEYLPKIAAIADVTEAPTAEQFNALLAALREAGYMET